MTALRSRHTNFASLFVGPSKDSAVPYANLSTSMRLFAVAASALLMLMAPAPASAQDGSAPRTVSVSGEGTVTAQPDEATVRFGIVTNAPTAEHARAQNAEASARAMNAVRDLDVPDEKIRMETLQLRPRREYNRETRQHEDKGYDATREVVVDVDDLEVIPELIARVVQEGANRLRGIRYGLSTRDEIRNDALRKAAQAAQAKARLLAETLGAQLGPVQSISEQNVNVPMPRVQMTMARAEASQAAPEPDAYAAGEMEVDASVQVTFVLRGGE
jgi:hypothetical protein